MVKIKGTEESAPGLAPTRIRIIMKSTADAGHITGDGLCLMTKAAEKFVQYLAKQAYKKRPEGKNSNLLTYHSLAEAVREDESLDFLQQIIPRKITVKKYKELLAEAKEEEQESSDSEEEQKDETEQKKSPKK